MRETPAKKKPSRARFKKPIVALMAALSMLPIVGLGLGSATPTGTPVESPAAAVSSAPSPAPPLMTHSTMTVENGAAGTLVQFEEPTAPSTTPSTTAPTIAIKEDSALTVTTDAPSVQIAPIDTDGLAQATRVTPPAQLERQRVESTLPEGVSYQNILGRAEALGLESREITTDFVFLMTQTEANRDIRQWDKVSEQTGVKLYDLTKATVANSDLGNNILTWDSAVMENCMGQWSGELAYNGPDAIKSAAQDFAARKMLGTHFQQSPMAFLQLNSSDKPGWLDLILPQGEEAIWKDVIQRVTQVAVDSGRMETWNVPVPHGVDAIKATFGQEGSNQTLIDAKIGPGGETKSVYAHEKIAPKIKAAFEEINARGLSPRIRSFGGLFVQRDKRTNPNASTHSWGIAMDINSAEYPLGTPIEAADSEHKEIARTLGRFGFSQVEGDAHHFQYATGY